MSGAKQFYGGKLKNLNGISECCRVEEGESFCIKTAFESLKDVMREQCLCGSRKLPGKGEGSAKVQRSGLLGVFVEQ